MFNFLFDHSLYIFKQSEEIAIKMLFEFGIFGFLFQDFLVLFRIILIYGTMR